MTGCLIDLSIDADFKKRIRSLFPYIDYIDINAHDDNPAEDLVYDLCSLINSFNKKIIISTKNLDLIKSIKVDAIRIKNTWAQEINNLDDYIEYAISQKIKILFEIHHIENNFLKAFEVWESAYPQIEFEIYITEFPREEINILLESSFLKNSKKVYFRDLPLCLSFSEKIVPSYYFSQFEISSFHDSHINYLEDFSKNYFKLNFCKNCFLNSSCLGCPRDKCSFMRSVKELQKNNLVIKNNNYIKSPDFLFKEDYE